MKKKSIFILIIFFFIFFLGFIIQKIFENDRRDNFFEDRRIVNFDDTSLIDEIHLSSIEQTLILQKKEGEWSSHDGYRVYQDSIEDLLTKTKNATIYSVVTFSVDDLSQYFLDENNALKFVFSIDGQEVGKFSVGQGNFGEAYILREGDSKIVDIKNAPEIFFNHEWRDIKIEDIYHTSIQKVSIANGSMILTIEKSQENGENIWTVNGKQRDQKKITDYIKGLSTLTASSFPDKNEIFEESNISVRIEAETFLRRLSIGQSLEDGNTLVKNSEGLLFFISTEKTLPKLLVSESDLR